MSQRQSLGEHPSGGSKLPAGQLHGVQVGRSYHEAARANSQRRLYPDFNRNLEIDIPIHQAGSFAFYATYTPLPDFSISSIQTPAATATPVYYIDVSPRLTLHGDLLPLNALSIFSLISKFMGSYPSDWDRHLKGISERGYNMVHFTPLVQRGASNSPYSIFDQLIFDPTCFPHGEKDIANLTEKMETEYGLLSLTDVVWNHTADNSEWLQQHPEAGYNVETAPSLEPALDLDDALLEFSKVLKPLGLPTVLENVGDLLKLMEGVKIHVISKIKLWEFYVVSIDRDADAAVRAWVGGNVLFPPREFDNDGLGNLEAVESWSLAQKADFLLQNALVNGDRLGERYRRRTDPNIAAALLTTIFGRYDHQSHSATDPTTAHAEMVNILDELNVPFYKEYDTDSAEILEQLFNRIKYVRLDDHGPKLGEITEKEPLIESYFTRLPINDNTRKWNRRTLALVNNGWIWNADAMVDNAGSTSRAYLRREVIVWTDCVKLRYGTSPKDNPWLWEHMAKYTRLMAKHFGGFRIDNCHSTPLIVAEYLLDEARKVRPNLWVCAELFTGSEDMDYVFVKRLGLSSLIREAMQAWSTGELSRLVHRHGGRPIGSFEVDDISRRSEVEYPESHINGGGKLTKEVVRRIKRTPVHALFMDCTHDNEVPAQKRDARDTLPNAALVSMCACATGSVMGYDEIYPRLIDLVKETRSYTSASSNDKAANRFGAGGIGKIKKVLNGIHTLMGKDGYDEMHVHHEGESITIHRVHPKSRKGYFLIAHTAFPGYGNDNGSLSPVHLSGTKARHLGSWMLEVDSSDEAKKATFGDEEILKGLPSWIRDLKETGLDVKEKETIISVPEYFPPGSIALFETWIPGAEHADGLDTFVTGGAKEAFSGTSLIDLNFILYRCESEERASTNGQDGTYNIPNHGPLVYAGLQGWWSILRKIVDTNDLGHALCNHLRDGQWPLEYTASRMQRMAEIPGHKSLVEPARWLKQRFDAIRSVPNFLLPRYFALAIRTAYTAAWTHGLELLSDNVKKGHRFLQQLSMVSVQMTGLTKSASLYPTKMVPCLAAGLPHFSSDWARCWGRDVFIALRGLHLGIGRFNEAKDHILAFASVLKHGMIPNLLSDGKLPRYNARDATWFFLQSIQDYTKMAPDGLGILREKVPRRFLPYDDTWFEFDDPRAYSKVSSLEDIIQEALQRHADGIKYREANAGANLDMQMKSEGFDIKVTVDWETGIIYGGSQLNCGTWMDKMGESDTAWNKGIPGTPRDGAAIEITGMLYSTLVWLEELRQKRHYRYSGVKSMADANGVISFHTWASKIRENFERCYYIPMDQKQDERYDVNQQIVNRRGIYKDLHKSGKEYEDYQLRCNFPIAMCVAPQLFTPYFALQALFIADSVLRGPLGMATLDPQDLNYRPYYNNSEESTDFATSKGRNYHQGPEWLWPTGFFLRALLIFDLKRKKTQEERTESFQQIARRLTGCVEAITESPWAGLPELTNKSGEYCADSVSQRYLV